MRQLRLPVPVAFLVFLLSFTLTFNRAASQDLASVLSDPEMLWGSEVPEGWTGEWPDELLTVAERSGFTRTMTTRDAHEFLDDLPAHLRVRIYL